MVGFLYFVPRLQASISWWGVVMGPQEHSDGPKDSSPCLLNKAKPAVPDVLSWGGSGSS